MWGLVQALRGQVRVASGMGGGAVLGWDMTAAMAMAPAFGLPAWLVAMWLPPIEAEMVVGLSGEGGDG